MRQIANKGKQHKILPYNPAKDFAPNALTSNAPFMLLVNPSLPIRSVGDLIAYVKERPGQLSYGSAGPGSPPHPSTELPQTTNRIQRGHRPHPRRAPAPPDLGGRPHPAAV